MTRTSLAVALVLALAGCENQNHGGLIFDDLDAGTGQPVVVQPDAAPVTKADAAPIIKMDAKADATVLQPPFKLDAGPQIDTQPVQAPDAKAPAVDTAPDYPMCGGNANGQVCVRLGAGGAVMRGRLGAWLCAKCNAGAPALPGTKTSSCSIGPATNECFFGGGATSQHPAIPDERCLCVESCNECSY